MNLLKSDDVLFIFIHLFLYLSHVHIKHWQFTYNFLHAQVHTHVMYDT